MVQVLCKQWAQLQGTACPKPVMSKPVMGLSGTDFRELPLEVLRADTTESGSLSPATQQAQRKEKQLPHIHTNPHRQHPQDMGQRRARGSCDASLAMSLQVSKVWSLWECTTVTPALRA